jgi:hypothetical protein
MLLHPDLLKLVYGQGLRKKARDFVLLGSLILVIQWS